MLYYNSQPLARSTPKTAAQTYQWRTFSSKKTSAMNKVLKKFNVVTDEKCTEKFFIIPGRTNILPRMKNDETFELREHVDDDASGLQIWEETVKTDFPITRSQSAMVGAKVPRFRGSFSSVADPDSLTEALQRKSKFFESKSRHQVLDHGGIEAEITEMKVDGEKQYSLSFSGDSREAILDQLQSLGLKAEDNMNFVDFLMSDRTEDTPKWHPLSAT